MGRLLPGAFSPVPALQPASSSPYRPDLPLQQLAWARVGVINEGTGDLRLLAVADGALQALPGEARTRSAHVPSTGSQAPCQPPSLLSSLQPVTKEPTSAHLLVPAALFHAPFRNPLPGSLALKHTQHSATCLPGASHLIQNKPKPLNATHKSLFRPSHHPPKGPPWSLRTGQTW